MDYFARLLDEKFLEDDRQLKYDVLIPGIGMFGLAPPSLQFWIQLFVFLTINSVINLIIALIVWTQVVKKRGSSTAILVTYGVVIPLYLILPFQLTALLGVQNRVLIIAFAAFFPLNILRSFEALYGTSRSHVEKNVRLFILYYTAPVTFVFDRKTESASLATRQGIMTKFRKLFPGFVETTVLLNYIIANSFAPFPRKEIHIFFDLFHWGNLLNNLIIAYLCEVYLEFGTRSAAIGISLLSGLETIEVNDNPLSMSTSVAEFWGVRWNRMVGELLRAGVFKPVYNLGLSRPVAVLATFLISGLFHEYIISVVQYVGNTSDHEPKYFYQTTFFLWNGCILLLEGVIAPKKAFQAISAKLPRPLKTVCVLMTTLPVAHWFLDEYGGIFQDFAVAFPLIRKL